MFQNFNNNFVLLRILLSNILPERSVLLVNFLNDKNCLKMQSAEKFYYCNIIIVFVLMFGLSGVICCPSVLVKKNEKQNINCPLLTSYLHYVTLLTYGKYPSKLITQSERVLFEGRHPHSSACYQQPLEPGCPGTILLLHFGPILTEFICAGDSVWR